MSPSSYPVLELLDDDKVFGVVVGDDSSGLVPISDLLVQAVVLLLQGAHLLQVGGQTVVQVLHCALLVGTDMEVQAVSQVEASSGRSIAHLGRGDAGATTTCSAVDTHGLLAVGSAAQRHVGGFGYGVDLQLKASLRSPWLYSGHTQ